MKTIVWRVDPHNFSRAELEPAASLLRQGRLVAFPTETVYGLGANALDSQAVQNIFRAKGRPSDNPLIVHIADLDHIWSLVEEVPPLAKTLAQAFWPGPLTLVLPASAQVPKEVTAGLETVAVRLPSHPIARSLIREAGAPIAAPSANYSGKPSPTTAGHVYEDLAGRIDGIIDGGSCDVGLESTVVDATGIKPLILRPGGVTREMLEKCIPEIEMDGAMVADEKFIAVPRSPGMKYTHYAPKAPVYMLAGSWEHQCMSLKKLFESELPAIPRGGLGLLISDESYAVLKDSITFQYSQRKSHDVVIRLTGPRENLSTVAARLFSALRSFDNTEVTLIIAETYPQEGIGLALMNRLAKAAGGRVWSD